MIPLLLVARLVPHLSITQPNTDLLLSHPEPSHQICMDMEHDIYQGVEFGIITQDQADELLLRCVINYSSQPGTYNVL